LANNRFVDPMPIKLPRGRVLEDPALASFERYDTVMNRQPPAWWRRARRGGK